MNRGTTLVKKAGRIIGMCMAVSLTLTAGSSAFGATPNPHNCMEILQTAYSSGATAPDGDYVIEPVKGRIFSVYCKDMSTVHWNPKEYLALTHTGGDYNFSQFTAGGWVNGTSVRTNYTKLRIDPVSTTIDIGDTTFTTTTGELCTGAGDCGSGPISYATALDCNSLGSGTGTGNIDLTGTPLVVNNEFYSNGYRTAGTVAFNGVTAPLQTNLPGVLATGKVVNITGGGYCGGTGPRGHNSYFDNWNGATSGPALHLLYVNP
jgi:hypothetical protein